MSPDVGSSNPAMSRKSGDSSITIWGLHAVAGPPYLDSDVIDKHLTEFLGDGNPVATTNPESSTKDPKEFKASRPWPISSFDRNFQVCILCAY